MQVRSREPSLNAVKAFEATARLGSLKAAAAALDVTPSAISHQIRLLEQEIGKRLFIRRNNAVELTNEGHQFFELVGPALRTISRAAEAARLDTKIVALNVTTSFAQLWLIPRLEAFRTRHPDIAVEMATARRPIVLDDSVEMTISYSRGGPPVAGAIELLKDFAMPMAAISIQTQDIRGVPLISTTTDDWDWKVWAVENGFEFAQLSVGYRFDTDAAAIAACKAGIGVALVPADMTHADIASGVLQPFGRFPAKYFGSYWLAKSSRLRPPAQNFLDWLLEITAAARITPEAFSR